MAINERTVATAEEVDPPSSPSPPLSPRGTKQRSLGGMIGRGAMWAVLANLTMRFASVAITAVLARLLSKEDFGVFAVAIAVYAIVASLAELGMGSAVARSATEPEEIAPTVTSISILISGVLGVAMAVTSPQLATLLGQPEAAGPLRILSLCLILTGIFAVPGAQLVREFRQDRIFLATVVGFLVGNPILIVLAVNGSGAEAFAWSRVFGQLATGIVFVLCVSRRYRPGWRRNEVGPLLRFGLPLSVANLVNWSLLNADYLILGRRVDAAQIGTYMIAFNVANWATALLGSVLNTVVVPAFGRVAAEPAKLGRAIVSATNLVALIAIPIGAMSLALAGPLVTTLFGQKWTDAIPVLAVLSLYGILYSFSLLFANVLVATGKTLRLLLIQLGWVAVLVPAMLLGLHLNGLTGVAWAHVITSGLIALPGYAYAVLRVTRQRLLPVLGATARPALGALLGGLVAWGLARVIPVEWIGLLAGGVVGVMVYTLVVVPDLMQRLPVRLRPQWVPARWRAHRRLQEDAS